MNTSDAKVKISTLWIVVMVNMLSADIIGFMNPGDLQNILKATGKAKLQLRGIQSKIRNNIII